MNCGATLYKNTGFNLVNRPDSPQTLIKCAESSKIWTMDILDPTRLSSVRVQITDINDLAGADYLQLLTAPLTFLNSMFYIVTDYRLTSPDVAELSLVPDYILSMGGYQQLNYMDGIVTRCLTGASVSDTMQSIGLDDELATPAYPLQCVTDIIWGQENNKTAADGTDVVEGSLDLTNPVDWDDSYIMSAGSSTVSSVLQPNVNGVVGQTTYVARFGNASFWTKAPGTRQYLTSSAVQKNIGVLQSLGISDAVVSSVTYPAEYFPSSAIHTSGDKVSYIETGVLTETTNVSAKTAYQGNAATSDWEARFNDDPTLFYNNYNRVGMITASGDQSEYAMTELMNTSVAGNLGSMWTYSPTVSVLPDPRPSGKPYFRFHGYLHTGANQGDDYVYTNVGEFMQGCISGLSWANSQLIYQGASGSYFNTLKYGLGQMRGSLDYTKNRQLNESQFRSNYADYINTRAGNLVNVETGLGGLALNMLAGNAAGAIGNVAGLAQTGIKTAHDEAKWREVRNQASINLQYNAQSYQLNQELNAAGYIQQQTVAPTIAFPFNADMYRDFCGNGVTVYRYRYADEDIERVGKLHRMYGIKIHRKLERTDFYRHRNFDFVQATAISINLGSGGYNIPMFIRDSIANALEGGIRVWHTTPGSGDYVLGANPLAV